MLDVQPRRSLVRRVHVAPQVILLLFAVGCATSAPIPPAAMALDPGYERAVTERPVPKRPSSRLQARDMLQAAFEAGAREDHQTAVNLFGAVLATDFLTDGGRTNLYWMKAESHRQLGDHDGRMESLGAFLIAAELVPEDDEIMLRRLLARSALAAMRVTVDPGFGRTPEMAISVEDVREPASIMASLSCGPAGRGHYVDVAIRSVERAEARLLQRRAECRPGGVVLELWFDVTHAGD
jgi:hypothetical protein